MRSVQENTSDEAMAPDRPHYTDPILESYSGSNHPYRGIEQHGVADTASPDDPTPEWPNGTRSVVYADIPKEPDPIPVKIVQEGLSERRRLRTLQYALSPGQVARIVSANPNRTKVRIKNTAAFTIYFSDMESVSAFMGYPLNQNETLDLDTQDELYAFNPDAVNTATVAIVDQFSVI